MLGDVLGGSERHVLEKMRGTAPARAVVAAANPVERLHGDDRQLAPLEHQHRQAICELDAADLLTPVPLVLSREHSGGRNHQDNREPDLHGCDASGADLPKRKRAGAEGMPSSVTSSARQAFASQHIDGIHGQRAPVDYCCW